MQDLFSEFKKTTAAEWKARMIKDLKGEAYETLIWKNENGFDLQPFYTAEDLKTNYTPAFLHSSWEIGVTAKTGNAKEINAQLLRDLAGGASSITLICRELDLEVALHEVQLRYIHAVFYVNENNHHTLAAYLQKHYNLDELNCCILPEALTTNAQLSEWIEKTAIYGKHKTIKTTAADILTFHNLDCFAYYEVAIALSALNEYLSHFSHNPIKTEAPFVIKTGVNTDYFVQIAKLRAIRRLWNILKTEYGIVNELYVLVETSLTNKSISDSYNNLLRTTLEAMAAVSGGCNELTINGFDAFFEVNASLSARMAINQQLILKEESYLDKMADTACGSYYIEHLTDSLAQTALNEFKRFEKEGGYFSCIEKNIFTSDIAGQARQHQAAIDTKAQTVIGVNKFRNEKEKIPLSAQNMADLKKLPINNPVLNFELDNFFTKHA